MDSRRDFMKNTIGVAALAGLGGFQAMANDKPVNAEKYKFNLSYGPHFGMFNASAGNDLMSQLDFMADHGFRSFEDNGLMNRTTAVQTSIGERLAKNGMDMGVFVIDAGDNWVVSYSTGKQDFVDKFVKECHKAVETAKRVNAKFMTVVPGYFARQLPIGIQTGNVIELYKRGAEIFEPHGLTMVMEPLSDNPDLFLRTSDQAYAICKAVGSPSCKILYDIYHMQRNEGRLAQHINWAWDEIAYFQIGDEPGRNEPGTGEINYNGLLRMINERAVKEGKEFIFGMEHGNSKKGKEGEMAVIEAYKKADDFL